MKITTFFIIIAALVVGAFAQPVAKSGTDVGIPGFHYIRDQKKFVPEDAKDTSPEVRRALNFARGIVALRLEKEIRGKFLIAEAAWGYQVSFTGIETKKDGAWTDEVEGFGEIFLSKGLDRVVINYGP